MSNYIISIANRILSFFKLILRFIALPITKILGVASNELPNKVDGQETKISGQIVFKSFRHDFPFGKSFMSVVSRDKGMSDPYFFESFPNGDCKENEGCLCFKLYVFPRPLDVKMVYWIEGTEIRVETEQYSKSGTFVTKVCTIEQIMNSNVIVDGELTIEFEIIFMKPHPAKMPLAKKGKKVAPVYALIKSNEPDFTIAVGKKEIMVHRNFISLISPVFRAMLEHDTIESRTNRVTIHEFSFKVVKDVIDFCYGRRLKADTIDEIMQDLVFADMYCMSGVLECLSKLLIKQLNEETFVSIVEHAWTYSSDDLKKACCEYFKSNQVALALTQEFCELDSEILLALESSL